MVLLHNLQMPTISRPKPRKPSKEFGEAACRIALEIWGTQSAVLREMGYTPDPKSETLRRLRRGAGSDESARALLAALKRKGVDTSKLPPMYPDEARGTDEEPWRAEWAWIGEMLHEHSPGIYEQTVDDLRPLARELARRTGNELEILRTR